MTDDQTVTIDGKKYPLSSLSKVARGHLLHARAADAEIKHLQMKLLIAQTAQKVFAVALKQALPK
jgi:hypothetical protein